MKKLFALLLAFVLLCGVSAMAENAVQVVYDMPELDLTMTLPVNYTVLTMNSSEEEFAALGADKAGLVEAMSANDTYMLIYPGVFTHEINVAMTDNALESINILNDEQMAQSAESVAQSFSELGFTVEKCEACSVGENKYIRTWYSALNGDATVYVMQYYTVENNKGIVYRMFDYTGEPIAQEMQDQLRSLIEGVHYN